MTTQCSTGKWITPVAGIVGALIVAATAAVSTQGGAPRYAADPSTQDPKREVDAGTPVQPMGAREAAVVPARPRVELAQQHE